MSRSRARPRVVASQVDPRLVARRRAVAAAAQRRRRRRLGLLLAGLGTAVVVVALAFSPLLSVEEIRVEGLQRLDEQVVLDTAGLDTGAPMLLVDLVGARAGLSAVPSVASAVVERDWPRTVVVRVLEERPLALVVHGGRSAAVAEGGRVLDGTADATSLVRVVSDSPVELRTGEWVSGPAARVVSMLEQMSAPLLDRVEEVRIAATGSVELLLDEGVDVLIGPPEDVPAKLLAVETVLERVVEQCLAVLDVRDPMRAAVSRAEGCDVPDPTDEPDEPIADDTSTGIDEPGTAG